MRAENSTCRSTPHSEAERRKACLRAGHERLSSEATTRFLSRSVQFQVEKKRDEWDFANAKSVCRSFEQPLAEAFANGGATLGEVVLVEESLFFFS